MRVDGRSCISDAGRSNSTTMSRKERWRQSVENQIKEMNDRNVEMNERNAQCMNESVALLAQMMDNIKNRSDDPPTE